MLRLRKTVAAVVLGLVCVSASAQTQDIYAEDFYSFFNNNNWSVWDYDSAVREDGPNGGTVLLMDALSTQWVATNGLHEAPSTFFALGGVFDLNSMWIASVYSSQTLTITGWFNGDELYTAFIDVTTAAQYVTIGFQGINSFTIMPNGDWWALGGVTIGTPVPEPETYAMLLAGLGVVGAVARRRKVNVN